MTIDEAIKILESKIPNAMPNNPPRHLEATQLGIEALKRHKHRFAMLSSEFLAPLPGETKD